MSIFQIYYISESMLEKVKKIEAPKILKIINFSIHAEIQIQDEKRALCSKIHFF